MGAVMSQFWGGRLRMRGLLRRNFGGGRLTIWGLLCSSFEAGVWGFKLHEQCVTLCYAIVIPSRKSDFRAGLWPDCYRESTEFGPPAGLRPATGPISVLSR